MNHSHVVPQVLGLLALSCLCAVPSVKAGEAQPTRLESIGLNSDEHGSLLTLSLSAPVAQHVFRLHNPERLVVDLPATQRRARLPPQSVVGPILAVRSGITAQQALRLVVELKASTPARLTPSLDAAHYCLKIAFGTPANSLAADARAPNAVLPAHRPVADVAPPPSVATAAATSTSNSTHRVHAAHAPEGEREVIVAVDAGHGGDDPGATGQRGTHEKDVTLAIARALAERINRESGIRAVLTRSGDYFVACSQCARRYVRVHSRRCGA